MDEGQNEQKWSEGNTKPLPKNERCRKWVFTSFLEEEPVPDMKKVRYLLYAPEECPTTGKKHWQGYAYFKNEVSFKTAQKALKCPKQHFEPAIADSIECQKGYIVGPYEKDGKVKPYNPDYVEVGDPPKQGKRTDLDAIKDSILSGETTTDDIMMDSPMVYHQYGRTLDKLEDLRMSKVYRTEMTTCDWYCGSTGIGKSHWAFKNFHPDTHYVLPNDKGWWDNYKQQETVIINDFRGSIPYNELLQMIDKWPYQVKRRGRAPLPFTSKRVIITSSLCPEEVYHNREKEDSIEQLLRRVKVINQEQILIMNKKEKYGIQGLIDEYLDV